MSELDRKIAQLPSVASGGLTDDDEFPLVNAGLTKRVTLANLRTKLVGTLAAIATSGSANDLNTGTVPTARLGSSSADATKFLRGDQTWQTVSVSPGGGAGQLQYHGGAAFAGAAFSAVATSGDLLTLAAQAATDFPLVVTGAASQSANLTEWRNSSNVARAYVNSNGDVLVQNKIYFEDTNGFIARSSGSNTMYFAPSSGTAHAHLGGSTFFCDNFGNNSDPAGYNGSLSFLASDRGGNTGNGIPVKIKGGSASVGDTDGGHVYLLPGAPANAGAAGRVVVLHDGTTGRGVFCVGNTIAAGSTLGTVVKKFPIYDETGTLLGYLPLYDAIT